MTTKRKEIEDVLKKNGGKMFHQIVDGRSVWMCFILMTPKLATLILADYLNVTAQRLLSPTVAQNYADEMKGGFWKFNPAPIIFGISNFLLDGMHRLKGVELSGMSFPMCITGGYEDSTLMVIDGGKSRVPADRVRWIMHELGISPNIPAGVEKNFNTLLGQICRNLWLWMHGYSPTCGGKIQSHELEDVIRRFPHVVDVARKIMGMTKPSAWVVPAHLGFLATVAKAQDGQKKRVDVFMKTIVTGPSLGRDDEGYNAIHFYRELRQAAVNKPNRRQLTATGQMIMLIKTWNCFSRGSVPKDVSTLYPKGSYKSPKKKRDPETRKLVRVSDPKGDTFPKIQGVPYDECGCPDLV